MTRTAAPPPQFSHELYLLAQAFLEATDPDGTDNEYIAKVWAYMGPGRQSARYLARCTRSDARRVALVLPRILSMAKAISASFYTGGHADD